MCSHKVIRVPREAADRGTEKEAKERRQGATGEAAGRQRNKGKGGQMAIEGASWRSSPTEQQETSRETRKATGYPAVNEGDNWIPRVGPRTRKALKTGRGPAFRLYGRFGNVPRRLGNARERRGTHQGGSGTRQGGSGTRGNKQLDKIG